MRRFELTDGTSEKFWEIERAGASVTVHFGRIGTNGQTQVKDLDDDAAAESHVSKLVAAKVKKGYAEVGEVESAAAAAPSTEDSVLEPEPSAPPAATTAPTTAPAAEPPAPETIDEDRWEPPPAWKRGNAAFRAPGERRPKPIDTTGASHRTAELLGDVQKQVLAQLAHDASDQGLVERARAHLLHLGGRPGHDGPPDPVGAAVLVSVASIHCNYAVHQEFLKVSADDWVARYGVAWAAEAGASLGLLALQTNQFRESCVRRAVADDELDLFRVRGTLGRLRSHLAATDDDVFADARARLAAVREGPLAVRIATSYLLPTEQAWVDEDIATLRAAKVSDVSGAILMASASTVQQAQALLRTVMTWGILYDDQINGFVARVGAPAAPLVAKLYDGASGADELKRLAGMLGRLPSDEAFSLLVDRLDQKYVPPVVMETTARFPRRATRLLARAVAKGPSAQAVAAGPLLRGHVLTDPSLVEQVRPELAPQDAAVLDGILASTARVELAPADRVPPLLLDPPWAGTRTRTKPVVIADLAPPTPSSLHWLPGEQEAWATQDVGGAWLLRHKFDWPDLLDELQRGGRNYQALSILAMAPPDLAAKALPHIAIRDVWNPLPLARILGGIGDPARTWVLMLVKRKPVTLAPVLAPYEGTEVAELMADWLRRSKTLRPVARTWLDRHAPAAARDLVPAALAKRSAARTSAEGALRYLHQRDDGVVPAAAASFGPEAAAAIEAMLAADPLDLLPPKMPVLPGWLVPAQLPPVLVADRSGALPPDAVTNLFLMCAISKPGEPYAGVEPARSGLEPASLAEVVWVAFQAWASAGYPSKDGWILNALGLLGDDETVRNLAPVIRAWPGEGGHARAVAGLDVLSAIGSDVALMHLHGISEKVKFKGLKTKAKEKMDEVAEGLGLTAEQLADRLVPDFGLEPDGSLLLDYGSRRFRVGFDEQLRPVVADEDGTRRKTLPKPGAKDDAAVAEPAYKRFSGLRKDVKVIAADQIRRFERAMVTGRRWTAAEQRSLFIDHPLLWHLVRRLVWATFDDTDQVTGSFRVAEDRTLADVGDEEVTLYDAVTVGIAHPIHLGDTVGAWSELFADYEILQPFPQLGRPVLALTDAERGQAVLTRIVGLKVATGKVLGLTHRGWERGVPQDGGVTVVTFKALPGGRYAVLDLDPGIVAGEATYFPEQTITSTWLDDGPPDWSTSSGKLAFGLLDPITASELLADLDHLKG